MSQTPISSTKAGRRKVAGVAMGLVAVVVTLALVLVIRQALTGGPAESEAASSQPTADEVERILRAAGNLLDEGEASKAEAILSRAVAKVQTDQDLRLMYAEALVRRDKHAEAHEQYVAAIAIGPDHDDLRFDAGTVASAAGLHEDAEQHYWQAQVLDPKDARYPLYLAQVQRRLGRLNEAKKNLLLAARLEPENDVAWGTLADVALQENNLSIARRHVAKARELRPDRVQWRLIAARIERRDNNPDDAIALLMGLSGRQRVEHPMVVRELALAFGLKGQPEQAARLYVQAAGDGPENRDFFLGAAEWFERAGMPDEAIVYASRAARMGSDEAQRVLDRVEASLHEQAGGTESGGQTGL